MKIAFFTDSWLPNVDGVVTSLVNSRTELEKRGHDVHVFAPGPSAIGASGIGVRAFKQLLKPLPSPEGDRRVHYYRSLKFPPYPQYRIAFFPYHTRREVKKAGVQLVHCHAMASMGFLARRIADELDLPLVGTFHTMLPLGLHYVGARRKWSKAILSEVAWRAIREFYRPFDLVIAPTNAIKTLLEEHGVEPPVVAIPNGIDLSRFNSKADPRIVRKLLGIQKDEAMVLSVGRLGEEKNLEVLIRAAREVLKKRRARFVIVGDGPARAKYEQLVSRLGLGKNFVFRGFVSQVELPFYYAACDVFATPSTFETQGLSVIEAMACGKPVVGANALALGDIIRDRKNGFLFKPFDSRECAGKILKTLALSAAEKKRMSREASKTALEYSVQRCTDRLLEAYKRFV